MASVCAPSFHFECFANENQARDCITAMESNDLDAMFIFTVAMGVITFLMAWIILVIAIKGWAVREENRSAFAYRQVA